LSDEKKVCEKCGAELEECVEVKILTYGAVIIEENGKKVVRGIKSLLDPENRMAGMCVGRSVYYICSNPDCETNKVKEENEESNLSVL